MPSKSLADLLCYSGFRSSATFVLRCYGPESEVICVNYLGWRFNFAAKITVYIFLTTNSLSRDIVCKESVAVLRNVKERNQQYVKSFFLFTEVPNVKYSGRMVFIKSRQNP